MSLTNLLNCIALRASTWLAFLASGAVILTAAAPATAQVGFTGSYSQSFNSLAPSSPPAWVNNSTLPGWFALGSGVAGTSGVRNGGLVTPAIAADAGASSAGGLHSYGATGQDERALGSIGSGGASAGDICYAVVLQNTTKETFRSTRVTYAGEQWRNGGNAVSHILVFDYAVMSVAPTSAELRADFTTGYIAPNSTFDFYAPLIGASATAVDGNLSAHSGGGRLDSIGGVLDVEWPAGSYLVLRWWDDNDSGNDHGLAIDDLSVTASTDAVAQTIVDTAAGGATIDGFLSTNEYGPDNTFVFNGAGGGFGGAVGFGSIRLNSDADNLYIAFQPGASLNDFAVLYLDTRVGGFDDSLMNDAGDAGRSVVANLGAAGDDTFPHFADFALMLHAGGCTLFELTEESLGVLPITEWNCGTGPDTQLREIAIPLASIGVKGGALPVDFFIAYCSSTLFNSNETNPPMTSINARSNPGNTGSVIYTLINSFITESPCSPPEAPSEATSSVAAICADDPGSITLSAIGGSGQTISWFTSTCDGAPIGTGATLIIDSPETTTTYFARWETPGCGASACASVTVNTVAPPIVEAGAGSSVCTGVSAVLSASGSNAVGFMWSGGTGTFGDASALSTTYTPGPGETGDVVLMLTATAAAPCPDAHDTVTITVNPAPTVNAGDDAITCGGSPVSLNGSGSNAAGFMWSGGAGTFADIFDPSTTYTSGVGEPGPIVLTLTATGLAGCSQVIDTVTITREIPPSVDAGSDMAACYGGAVSLNGSGSGAGFMWSGGAGKFADPTNPQTTYTPGPGEFGAVTLTLMTAGNSPCAEASDAVVVNFAAPPTAVYVDDDYAGLPDSTSVNFPHNGLPGPLVIGCNAFSTLQAAHDAANDAGTIGVAPGTYSQSVAVTRQLTLLGAEFGVSGCIARAGAIESVISVANGLTVQANSVIIDGFVIQDAAGGAAGITIDPTASGYDIRNNIIRANSLGILANAEGSSPSFIRSNRFDSNNAAGPAAGRAIASELGADALTVNGNCFSSHDVAAIAFTGAAGTHTSLSITGNSFVGDAPIALSGVSDLSLTLNAFAEARGVCISIEGDTSGTLMSANSTSTGAGGFLRISDLNATPGSNADVEVRDNTLSCDVTLLASSTAIIDLVDAAGETVVSNNTIIASGALSHEFLHAVSASGVASGSLRIADNVFSTIGLMGGMERVGVRLLDSLGNTSPVTIEGNSIMGFQVGIQSEAARTTIKNNRGSISANEIGILVSGPTAAALIENNDLRANTLVAIRVQNSATVDAGNCTGSDPTGLGPSAGLNDLTGYAFDNAAPWAIENFNLIKSPSVTATSNTFGAGDIGLLVRDTSDDPALSSVVSSSSDGPTVTADPSDTAVCDGLTAQFSVQAINAATYQWRREGVPILGAESPSIELLGASLADAGEYDCVVTDICGLSVASLPATLTVLPSPHAPTKVLVDRTDFCADDAGTITLTAFGGSGDSVEWFADDCGGALIGAGASLQIASPIASTTYFARWRNACGFSGCTTVTVAVLAPPIAPTSAGADRVSICPNDAGSITLSATGGSGATLAWFAGSCDGTPIGNGTNLLIPSPNSTTTYFARWENSCGPSGCAQVTVSVADNAPPVPDVAKLPPITGECAAIVTKPPTATDNCAGAIVGTTSDPLSYDTQGTFVITWTFDDGHGNTSTQPQTVIVDDTTAPVVVCRDATVMLDATGNGAIAAAEVIQSMEDNCGLVNIVSAVPSTFTCADLGPVPVLVTVDDGHGNTAACTATVSVIGGVSITSQPQSQTVCERQGVTFSVIAAAGESAGYQWRFNTVPIPDATSSSLTLTEVSESDEGSYDVVITDACGPIISDAAVLAVDRCPVIYVDHDAAGAENGTSWMDAFTRLEDALAASVSGDQIWVAEGIYHPDAATGDRTRAYQLRSGVEVLAGFSGIETNAVERDALANPTILSGGIGKPGLAADNSFHVVNASGVAEGTLLDGFTIEHGNANGATPDTDKGAGLLCLKGNPTIRNCTFRDNAAVRGGAIFIEDSFPTIVACDFSSNSATDGGGAVRAVSSAPSFVNCRFMLNASVTTGGAILNTGASDTRLVQCLFARNNAASGGAITNALGSFLSVSHCTIANNVAFDLAGGLLITQASSSAALSNTILYANIDSSGGGEAAQIRRVAGDLLIDYSCVQGFSGALGGIGNIATDPRFIDPDGPDNIPSTLDDDFRPGAFSSVIDAGSNTLADNDDLDLDVDNDTSELIPTDLDGAARRGDDPGITDTGEGDAPIIDIGAYEFAGLSCPCDFNHSGTLNSQDFFDFLNAFFESSPSADFNADLVVNSQDFFDFLACFFEGCA